MFSKHFHMCFFKLKCPTAAAATPPPHPKDSSPSSSSTTTTTFLFSDDLSSSSSNSSDDSSAVPPDFSSLFSSHRFFFSSPGSSNSIFESPDTRPSSASANRRRLSRSLTAPPSPRGVEVPKYSSDPYVDFRRSMQEMIDSRELVDVTRDWDYLHDLLLCYLSLNHPHNHRYIVQAFTDLLAHLLSSPQPTPQQPTSL